MPSFKKIDAFHIKGRADDGWVDECLAILREGLAEFPQNERLLLALADTLSEAGWRKHQEWLYYDEKGYICHDYDIHKKNPYWEESIEICEMLANSACDSSIVSEAIAILVMLYRNIGENGKAVACAERMPGMKKAARFYWQEPRTGKRKHSMSASCCLKWLTSFPSSGLCFDCQ